MTSLAQTRPLVPSLAPVYAATSDLAEAGLRIAAGAFLVPHGAQKLFGWFGGYGLEATGQFFETQLGFANGLLAALGAGSVETFGGLLLALGLLTRPAAAAIAVMLLVAATVHLPNGFFWTSGGWEYPVLWATVAGFFAIRGGGRLSLDRLIGREI
ncbi:DoxX family protein [Limibaculum sp. M0105]|uniref:DoxX family protein n=1 Tax=Thermohalobaculum xanthum TaxID=2753746 RepID=A0A8J7MB74_9RHOB|nr:DoxX family protein [Thermohalobaculum xanthum]MBK0400929.1 DoxX family protein [Thermohalobaculum xanthum]